MSSNCRAGCRQGDMSNLNSRRQTHRDDLNQGRQRKLVSDLATMFVDCCSSPRNPCYSSVTFSEACCGIGVRRDLDELDCIGGKVETTSRRYVFGVLDRFPRTDIYYCCDLQKEANKSNEVCERSQSRGRWSAEC